MDKKKVKDVLGRYIKSLRGASGKTIITNFGKMREFVNSIDDDEKGSELSTLLELITIQYALQAINREKISLKDNSTNWNSEAIARGYQLEKEISYLWEQRPKGEEKINKMRTLLELTVNEKDTATQLCLWKLYLKGYELRKEDVLSLLNLLKDEPISKE